jgi:hypothetical protein
MKNLQSLSLKTLGLTAAEVILIVLAGPGRLQADTIKFVAPPGLAAGNSDFLSIVTYMANGNIATEDRCTIGEPPNDTTPETTCAKGPLQAALAYFPDIPAGGTLRNGFVLLEPVPEGETPTVLSDQLFVTIERPQNVNMLNVSFELRSDPTSFIRDAMGRVLMGFGSTVETGDPQDLTDFILNPALGGQYTAARVWAASDVEPVPEPATLLLVSGGLLGAFARRRTGRRSAPR